MSLCETVNTNPKFQRRLQNVTDAIIMAVHRGKSPNRKANCTSGSREGWWPPKPPVDPKSSKSLMSDLKLKDLPFFLLGLGLCLA